MKIAIDCDDAAVSLKATVLGHLRTKGFDVTDLDYLAPLNQKRSGYPVSHISPSAT